MRTIKEIWNLTQEQIEKLSYLYIRWQDEKEYEDITDYLVAAKKVLPEAIKISKKPFAITCQATDGRIQVIINNKTIRAKVLT